MIKFANAELRNVIAAALLASLSALVACSPASQPVQSQQAGANLPQGESTAEVMRRFNQVFADHDPSALPDLIAQDVVMKSIQPAPNGTRYEGYQVNLAFWQALAADRSTQFDTEEMTAIGDRAIVRWRQHFGEGQSIRGVTLLRVRDGRIVEALAYSKVPGAPAPLPSQH